MSCPGFDRGRVPDRDRLAERVAHDAPLAVLAVQRLLLASTPGPRRPCRRCFTVPSTCEAEPVARVLAAARRREVDAGDLELADLRGAPGGHACARGRRSRCAAVSFSSSSPSGRRGSGRASRRVPRGSLTRYGVAETSLAGSETASSTPVRSVIEPRCAGSATSATCCVAAAFLSVLGLDERRPSRRAGRRCRAGRGRPRRAGRCGAASSPTGPSLPASRRRRRPASRLCGLLLRLGRGRLRLHGLLLLLGLRLGLPVRRRLLGLLRLPGAAAAAAQASSRRRVPAPAAWAVAAGSTVAGAGAAPGAFSADSGASAIAPVPTPASTAAFAWRRDPGRRASWSARGARGVGRVDVACSGPRRRSA